MNRRFGKWRADLGAAILPAVLALLGGAYLLLLTVIAVAAHELGHYLALRRRGGEVQAVRLELTGVSMEYGGALSYGGELSLALGGPAASLALAALCAFFGRVSAFAPLYHLSGLSALLGAFNLLPVYPLDGGRALYSAVSHIFGLDAADAVTRVLGGAAVLAALAGGAYLAAAARNFTLLIAAVWLAGRYVRMGRG
jgi:stage IV sporulation protein FB